MAYCIIGFQLAAGAGLADEQISASLQLFVVLADLLDEEFLNPEIARRVIQNAIGGAAIASGAARFLVIGFHAARQVVMQHEADVGLVDAHAEGVGGHDDRAWLVHEALLAGFALATVSMPA